MKPYNCHRVGLNMIGTSEIHLSTTYSADYNTDYTDEDIAGNIRSDMSYGIGLGYLFRARYDNSKNSLGFGLKTVIYPYVFYKFAATCESELLGLGGHKFNFFILPGFDFYLTNSWDFKRRELHLQLSLAEFNFYQFSLGWALQSPIRHGKADTDFDDSYSIVEFSYHFRL